MDHRTSYLRTNSDPKGVETVTNKITGACWASFSKSNVWAGFFSTGLGHVYFQQEGNKTLSMMEFGQLCTVTLADCGEGGLVHVHCAWKPCFRTSVW